MPIFSGSMIKQKEETQAETQTSNTVVQSSGSQGQCQQLPGTIVRIFIPAGAVINLLNIIEVTSPSGICLIVRLPFIGGSSAMNDLVTSIRQAGGSVEVVNG